MTLTNTTHLNFNGTARQALEFYATVFGGQPIIATYADMPDRMETPEQADSVIWGQVATDDGFRIMAYDVQSSREYDQGVNAFYESVRAQSVEQAQQIWDGLSDGATVREAFGPSQWAPAYGMLTDRFGITWVIDVEVSYQA